MSDPRRVKRLVLDVPAEASVTFNYASDEGQMYQMRSNGCVSRSRVEVELDCGQTVEFTKNDVENMVLLLRAAQKITDRGC